MPPFRAARLVPNRSCCLQAWVLFWRSALPAMLAVWMPPWHASGDWAAHSVPLRPQATSFPSGILANWMTSPTPSWYSRWMGLVPSSRYMRLWLLIQKRNLHKQAVPGALHGQRELVRGLARCGAHQASQTGHLTLCGQICCANHSNGLATDRLVLAGGCRWTSCRCLADRDMQGILPGLKGTSWPT